MSAHFLSCHDGSRRDVLAERSKNQDRIRIKRGTHVAGLSIHSHHQEKQALKLVAR